MKGGLSTLYERIKKEWHRLQKQIDAIQKKMKNLPEGKLICSHNGSRTKWYLSDGHQKRYIPKKDRNLAEQLAVKKYLMLRLEDLLREQRTLEFYLNHHSEKTSRAERLLTDIPGYRELLSPFFLPEAQRLSEWGKASYERNPKYPEQLIHKTSSGNLVRSKSEAIIDLYLYTNHIPFRYECAIRLGETTLFPDFTICHPKTQEIYYWEHFGKMDDPFYYKNVYSKLQLYNSYGIVPLVNLITTYETQDSPLSSEVVEKIVEHYFL